MNLLQRIVTKVYGFIRPLKKQDYRNCAVLVSGVAIIAIVAMCATGFNAGGKNKVYAVQSSDEKHAGQESQEEPEASKLQAGLMGIVSSVNSMEEFSLAASTVDLDNAYEEIIVGTSKVKKTMLNTMAMEQNSETIGNVGYFAQQTVRENHMASEDYYSLLQIVEAEATGGDLRSKILVANVVLNRVEDSRFPDKIYDVVWEKRGGAAQFSPTADGRIHSVAITEDTYEAVECALAGEDYSEGALFFVARASADKQNVEWFDKTLDPLFEYGGHEYYKFVE